MQWRFERAMEEYTREHWREAAREEFRMRVFALSDGTSITGGDATVEQLKIIMQEALEDAVACNYAIEDIQSADVSTLNELIGDS